MRKYVEIARIEEIPKNGMKAFSLEGQEILLVNVQRKLYAVGNRCPHMGYPLYFGSLEGKVLTCGFHSAKFDLTTGKVLNSVTQKPLKIFKTKIQNSQVFIKL
jgi:nitrite reductase/ring-hydroxylating ferredoxin subunit